MSDLDETIKQCKECGAKKSIDKYLSVDGLRYVNRCFRCRAKKKRKEERKLRRKRAVQFGEDWEQRVKEGNQCCKKCSEIKPNDRFQRITRSGISICISCTPKKSIDEYVKAKQKEAYRKRREKNMTGKSTYISYVKCQFCSITDVKRPKRTYQIEEACYKCCVNRRGSNRSKAEMISELYPNIDRSSNKRRCTSCLMWKPNDDYHSLGVNRGRRSKCKECVNLKLKKKRRNTQEWKDKEARKERLKKEKEEARLNRERAKTEPSPIEYINCKSCGDTEVVRKGYKTLVKNCCRKCSYNVRNTLRYWEKIAKDFTSSRLCDQCNKVFCVVLSDHSKSKCTRCVKANDARSRRKARQYRNGVKRTARQEGIRYDPYDVFKRDKWKCRLCGTKVQKRNHLLDDAAEIDHIVPISKGGRDIPSNVQCLCRKCNGEKSDRTIGQVSLFAVASE